MYEIKNDLRKAAVVCYYTYLDIIRSKILVNVGVLGIGLLVVTYVAFQFTYGNPTKVALDFGLGTLSLSSVGIALFFGSNLLSKEIDQRTIHMIISRPVPRYAFILGKISGLIIVLFLNVTLLSLLTLSIYFVAGGEYQNLILWSILFIFLEAVIVLLLVVFLSLLTSQTLSILLTIVLYVVGHALGEVKELSFVSERPALQVIIEGYKFVLPAFYKLNLKDYVLYNQSLSLPFLLTSLGHALFYGMATVFGCIFILNKKSLD